MKRAVTSVVASALLAVSFTSTAAPIRMTAEGVVFNSAYPGVEVGDPWTLEVIFDPATMTLFEQIGDTQAAYTPLQSFALTLGPFRLEDTSNEWLVILDDHLGGLDQPVDTMLFEVIFSDGGGVLFSAIYEGGGPITSLDLPTDVAAYQPIFDGTTNRLLTVFSPSVDAAVGAATSVRFEPVAVSEAGTLGLVCASLVGLLLTHARLPSRRRPSAVRQVT